jgi:hypothetical protein
MNGQVQGEENVLPAGEDRKVFGGKGGWSFGEQNMDQQALSPEHAKRGKRRGHHVSSKSSLSGASITNPYSINIHYPIIFSLSSIPLSPTLP